MLREWKGVRQRPEEGFRRWFSDDDMDLIVWYDGDHVTGFQLCYNKQSDQHALTWLAEGSYSHARVDDGEVGGLTQKKTPILVQDGTFDSDDLARSFLEHADALDEGLRSFVYERVRGFPRR